VSAHSGKSLSLICSLVSWLVTDEQEKAVLTAEKRKAELELIKVEEGTPGKVSKVQGSKNRNLTEILEEHPELRTALNI